MHGNVWQPLHAPINDIATGCGGSWYNPGQDCIAAERGSLIPGVGHTPTGRYSHAGLRLVRVRKLGREPKKDGTVTGEAGLAAGKPVQLKSFAAADPTITRDGVTPDQGGWRIDAKESRTVRLFEPPTPGVKDCVLIYRAKLKSKDVEGRAFLEMLCQIAFQGEGWSKGGHNAISGTNDWATYEIPFFLGKGQRADLLKLNLAIEGKGTVWIKDIEVLQSRPKGTSTWPIGPFVILATDGKAEQAYLALAEAVAAARDGGCGRISAIASNTSCFSAAISTPAISATRRPTAWTGYGSIASRTWVSSDCDACVEILARGNIVEPSLHETYTFNDALTSFGNQALPEFFCRNNFAVLPDVVLCLCNHR